MNEIIESFDHGKKFGQIVEIIVVSVKTDFVVTFWFLLIRNSLIVNLRDFSLSCLSQIWVKHGDKYYCIFPYSPLSYFIVFACLITLILVVANFTI